MIIAGLAILIIVSIGYFILRPGSTSLSDSANAFSVPTHVGQPAPAFTAIGVDGQSYTFTPGDGRPTAIVFYMGYG